MPSSRFVGGSGSGRLGQHGYAGDSGERLRGVQLEVRVARSRDFEGFRGTTDIQFPEQDAGLGFACAE